MYGVIHSKENEQLWGAKWFIFHEFLKSNMKQHSHCVYVKHKIQWKIAQELELMIK